MTTQELINYYANLLILQYLQKPKAYTSIQASATPIIMAQSDLTQETLPLAVQDGYNLTGSDLAIGLQLNTLGKYAGVSRSGSGFFGPITLDDSDFATLIQIAILTNSAGSSLATIQSLLQQFFPNEVLVFDYQTMRMSYLISSSIGSQDLIQLVVSEGLLPKPMGVELAATIYAPVIDRFFGFQTYQYPTITIANNEPFNTYSVYNQTWPWISYANAISSLSTPNQMGTEDGNAIVQEDGDGITINP